MDKWKYMLGGRATFTVVSQRTGKRFTFKVIEVPKHKIRGRSSSIHFVRVLNGPDNTASYLHIGTIFSRMTFRPVSAEAPSAIVFAWLFCVLGNSTVNELPNADFLPSGRCCRCGRLLTTPESIAAGIGPECATKTE